MNQLVEEMYLDCNLDDISIMNSFDTACNNAVKSKDVIQSYMVGGNHYKNKIQPWDIIDSWGLNFYEGNILKYLLRHKDNRVQDIEKLIHYADKLLELERGKSTKV